MKDIEVFEGFSLDNLMKEIYLTTKKRTQEIDEILKGLDGTIEDSGDAILILPVIKEFFDVKVRNDDNLVKMATIVQRLLSKTQTVSSDSGLSEEEKKELLENIRKEASDSIEGIKLLDKQNAKDIEDFTLDLDSKIKMPSQKSDEIPDEFDI